MAKLSQTVLAYLQSDPLWLKRKFPNDLETHPLIDLIKLRKGLQKTWGLKKRIYYIIMGF